MLLMSSLYCCTPTGASFAGLVGILSYIFPGTRFAPGGPIGASCYFTCDFPAGFEGGFLSFDSSGSLLSG